MQASYRSTTLLFGITLFVSAALLFSVQPMVAKLLLPLLGGTPAVWNTCMVFFQAALLAGYAYALLISRCSLQRQLLLQLVLLLLAFVSLPIGLPPLWSNSVPATDNPSVWLLACLLAIIGLPFFIVSSNGPLLQKWFSASRSASAEDPYFLYATSNAGSFVALLTYPLLVEPNFSLRSQSWIWTGAYGLLVLLIGLCGFAIRRSHRQGFTHAVADEGFQTTSEITNNKDDGLNRLSVRRRVRWVLLAFVPSSLMLGVTNYISTDIAAVPLLWVIPLALYLLTLVFAFARYQLFSPRVLAIILPAATLVFCFSYLLGSSARPGLIIAVNLIFFFFAALTCHTQLAADRPPPLHLPEFYFWLSLGGVLGGAFNALLAPVIFNSIIEYPLIALVACLLLRPPRETTSSLPVRWLDFLVPAGALLVTLTLALITNRFASGKLVGLLLTVSVPMILIYPFRRHPLRFVFSLGAIMLGTALMPSDGKPTLNQERNFFGVLRVDGSPSDNMNLLVHGNTIHGRQYTDADRRCEPLSYYHSTGPLGEVINAFHSLAVAREVAIVGLGTGASAVYALPNERWTFYEINPAVLDIARNPNYFTYIVDCIKAPLNVVLGDARLKLREAPGMHYGLIVLDAFSSDAIPIHLITQQALDLYLSKLAPRGLLVFHISNRNVDLSVVLADLARSRNLHGIVLDDPMHVKVNGKDPSVWVVMARDPAELTVLMTNSNMRALPGSGNREIWTDDFSNIISVLRLH